MVYYIFRKSDGRYMGNGVTHYDDDYIGSTTEPVEITDGQSATWDGSAWVIV